MKKLLLITGLSIMTFMGVYAQQLPLYSQYMHNKFLYNPAQTGFTDGAQLNFIYRKQWVDFEGAPETRLVSWDMPVGNDKFGIGAYLFSDNASVFRRWGGYISYAYHINFGGSTDHRLSIGLAAGAQDHRIDFDRIVVTDANDPLLLNNADHSTSFDANAGINYHFKGFNFGVAVPHVLATELQIDSDLDAQTFNYQRHYLAHTSYRIGLAQDRFFITPRVLFRTVNISNFDQYQMDGGVTFSWKDNIWVDGTYRYDYGVTIGGGFRVFDAVSVGYSYDLAMNDIADYQSGTHEFMLGVNFGGRKDKKMDEETKENIDKMMEKMAMQDSVIAELQAEDDSLGNAVDSLNRVLEQILEGGVETEFEGEFVDSLENQIQKLQEQMDDLKDKVDKNTQMSKEMTEEKTRVVDEEDLEYKHGAPLGDYFMVVGSFRIEQNSYDFEKELNADGFNAGVVYDKKRKWYYVYLSQPDELEKGLEELYKLREENDRFHDAWIHIMSKTMR